MSREHRILVIGAGGQLGAELTQGLWRLYGKENVIATDIKNPGNIIGKGNFEILNALDREILFSFIRKNKITQVYHLAAILSAKGEQNPKSAWHLNMDSLLNVLDAAVEHKVDKVYWPSSIAVFGPTTPKDKVPQHTIMEPTTIYGISKLAGERWCEWYNHKYGLDVRSLRYPGLIGYRSHAGGGTTDYAVEIFFKAVQDKKYTCYLSPDTYLPMMYMDDAIRATLNLMEAPAEKIKVRSSYNVASFSFCPEDLSELIKKYVPEFQIAYAPDYRQKIAESWPGSIDDSVARSEWNWEPSFSLTDMVEDMMNHLQVKSPVV